MQARLLGHPSQSIYYVDRECPEQLLILFISMSVALRSSLTGCYFLTGDFCYENGAALLHWVSNSYVPSFVSSPMSDKSSCSLLQCTHLTKLIPSTTVAIGFTKPHPEVAPVVVVIFQEMNYL